MPKANAMGLASGEIGGTELSGAFIGAGGFFALVYPPRVFNPFLW